MRIGAYDVLGELGRGGMGVVYRVRAPDGRDAALKVLLKADASTFARFERERRLLASLGEEQGFVGLLDAGVSEPRPWLLMPFVPGGTLRQKLEQGPLGVEETIVLGLALARALGAAHERGIVHRDVKPENVLFTSVGRPLLADMGLAKHFDPEAKGATQSVKITERGAFKGTAGYMAPEQLDDAASVGPRADVFALGAVLHECLAGRPAFPGDTMLEMLQRLGSGTLDPIGRPVPRWLEETTRRALSLDPDARFADGGALARALQARGTRPRSGISAPLALGLTVGSLLLAAIAHGIGLAVSPRSKPPVSTPHAIAPPETPASARELHERAMAKLERGDVDGEIKDETRAIQLDPTFALAWANRGSARASKDDLDGAIADLTKAIELDPSLAMAWANRGLARVNKGDPDGAIADETRAIELDSSFARAWQDRGSARGAKRD
jgi:serine/threonine protein kinase